MVVRKLHLLSVPAIVAASLFMGTGVALADDDAYIAKLHSLGVTWPAGEDGDAIALGHSICADRAAGKTPDQLATEVHTALSPKGFTYADGAAIVSAAESAYCP